MFLLKKFKRLPYVQMMIEEYKQLIQQKHMHMEQTKIQYVNIQGEKKKLNVMTQ